MENIEKKLELMRPKEIQMDSSNPFYDTDLVIYRDDYKSFLNTCSAFLKEVKKEAEEKEYSLLPLEGITES